MSDEAYGTEPGDPTRARLLGGVGAQLSEAQVAAFVEQAFAGADLDDKRVCLVVPDRTRTCPLPLILTAVHRALAGRAKEVTVLIALGTHQAMSDAGPRCASRLPGRRAGRRPTRAGRSSTTSPGCRRPSPRSAPSAGRG